ncbi:ATPase [Desulfobacter hydrogenophilus]|uniref:ATP synthase subunit b n=1 Tax=Desulfobacter hydrogenophilus TaxID=2291 RepID=A0A328FG60_9BACT|nr:ATPase [Desulfobacter hydrogenophilus]NDY71576.1 ATP synthase F0 subunit B [Desulfobacter hydrogenophilus]QBH15353.1 ATPase [Desulfobacter hydrogenophilus]RAM02432.1 ATPase [Desulfobacter hydrogenophilus]
MITVIPDISAVYQMVNFLVLLFLLNLVLYKPIRNVILKRKAKVGTLSLGVEKSLGDLEKQKDDYKNGLRQARGEGLKQKEVFIEEASAQEKEIITRINQKAQANFAQIKAQVAEETEQARKALEAEVEVYAKAIGEKILGRAC